MPKSYNNHSIPVIGITMGDPAGIGAEVIVKALSDPEIRQRARFIIYGMNELLTYAADMDELDIFWWRDQHERIKRNFMRGVVVADYDEINWLGNNPRKATSMGGQASMRFVNDAVLDAISGKIDAVVTAPINKHSWQLAEYKKYPGHTELLIDYCKSRRGGMMFVGGPFRVVLATIHESLFGLRHKFKIGTVFEPIDLVNDALKQWFGIEKPKIAVCALNPHAGENGQFGDEEERIISPAILMAQEAGIDVIGPFAPDTIFHQALDGRYDAIVAMYHDQGLIPVKLLAFDRAVNVTIGLPIIRTSVDHGTAFDIAGKNQANPESMKAAIRLACEMATIKSQKKPTPNKNKVNP
jgi:4-hydroxythreonine-4-phosphate dehydrogenase